MHLETVAAALNTENTVLEGVALEEFADKCIAAFLEHEDHDPRGLADLISGMDAANSAIPVLLRRSYTIPAPWEQLLNSVRAARFTFTHSMMWYRYRRDWRQVVPVENYYLVSMEEMMDPAFHLLYSIRSRSEQFLYPWHTGLNNISSFLAVETVLSISYGSSIDLPDSERSAYAVCGLGATHNDLLFRARHDEFVDHVDHLEIASAWLRACIMQRRIVRRWRAHRAQRRAERLRVSIPRIVEILRPHMVDEGATRPTRMRVRHESNVM